MSPKSTAYNLIIFASFFLTAFFPSAITFLISSLMIIVMIGLLVIAVLQEKDPKDGDYPM